MQDALLGDLKRRIQERAKAQHAAVDADRALLETMAQVFVESLGSLERRALEQRRVEPQPSQTVQRLTVAEVATALRVNRKTVYEWINEGLLPAKQFGGKRSTRVREDDLEIFAEGREDAANYDKGEA